MLIPTTRDPATLVTLVRLLELKRRPFDVVYAPLGTDLVLAVETTAA